MRKEINPIGIYINAKSIKELEHIAKRLGVSRHKVIQACVYWCLDNQDKVDFEQYSTDKRGDD